MRYAVIDCGTNTFNLLVADIEGTGEWRRVFSNSIPVKLAPSANTDRIGKNRFARGIDALFVHKNNIINLKVDEFIVVATSAIRESLNGLEFVEKARTEMGIVVEIIDGEREADLIYKGVKESGAIKDEAVLVMDIGGGSVEFIICNQHTKIWSGSYQIGVSRLKGEHRPSDPLSAVDLKEISIRLRKDLKEVLERAKDFSISHLVGSSGSFDSLVHMISAEYDSHFESHTHNEIDLESYNRLSKKLIQSTFDERLVMPGLVPVRADMIVLSILLINEVLELCNIQSAVQSEYALKEGLMSELAAVNAWNDN